MKNLFKLIIGVIGLAIAIAVVWTVANLMVMSFSHGRAEFRRKQAEVERDAAATNTAIEANLALSSEHPASDDEFQTEFYTFWYFEFQKVPKIWTGTEVVLSLEGKKLEEQQPDLAPELAAEFKKQMTSFKGKLGEVEIEFTPIPPFLRTPGLGNKEESQLYAKDRVQFIKLYMKAKHRKGYIYSISRNDSQEEFALVMACAISEKPGTLMLVGKSIGDIENAAKKLNEARDNNK